MTKYLFSVLALLLSCCTLAAQQGQPVDPGTYTGPNLQNDNDLIMSVSAEDTSGNQNVIVIEYDENDDIVQTIMGQIDSNGDFTYFLVDDGEEAQTYSGSLFGEENSNGVSLTAMQGGAGIHSPAMLPSL